MSISVDIEKKLGAFELEAKFDAEEETLALLGASGCGKSMTLKCIAGIEKPDRGRIVLDGVTLFDSEKHINLPPQERHVGLMFQNYALFPNMTVLKNIEAGARREADKYRRGEAVSQIIESFGLSGLLNHYPHQLSGGQQQRVALARILVSNPHILLLDEPFSALDSHLRFRLENEVRSVIQKFGKTVLLVSHDRDEVYRMADSIAVMNNGKIEDCDIKEKVFASPKTRTGALLTGCRNISKAEKLENGRVLASDWEFELTVTDSVDVPDYVGIRMQDIRPCGNENSVLCRVLDVVENPFSVSVILRCAEDENALPIEWQTDRDTWAQYKADELYVSLPANSVLNLKE